MDDASIARLLNRADCGVQDPNLQDVFMDYFCSECRKSDDESELISGNKERCTDCGNIHTMITLITINNN
jgi:hypothetical protein